MQKYELTVVLDGKATAAKKKAAGEKITKQIEASKGKVGKTEDWGVRDLAYPIGKSTSGVCLYFPLELEASAAKTLSAKLKAETDFIRYLLVRAD